MKKIINKNTISDEQTINEFGSCFSKNTIPDEQTIHEFYSRFCQKWLIDEERKIVFIPHSIHKRFDNGEIYVSGDSNINRENGTYCTHVNYDELKTKFKVVDQQTFLKFYYEISQSEHSK